MVAEPWILKMGQQVSTNLKHALYHENSTKSSSSKKIGEAQTIGILSFEVANVMSKIIHLHNSLTQNEILRLKTETLKCKGILTLVSNDEKKLLELALVEKVEDLNKVAGIVSRLGKKCSIPALQGFEHVYGDIVSGRIDVKELGFLVKDMDGTAKKMERYVNSTASLYTEMAVMNELEVATKKVQQNQPEERRKVYEQKLVWQKQDVKHLKNVSLWNQTYDKIVELLVRTVCTIYARVYFVFGNVRLMGDTSSSMIPKSQVNCDNSLRYVKQNSGHCHSRTIVKKGLEKRNGSFRPKTGMRKSEGGLFGPEDFNFACGVGPGKLFMECLTLSSSKVDDDEDDRATYDDQSNQISGSFTTTISSGLRRNLPIFSGNLQSDLPNEPRSRPKSRLLVYAPPNTVGGSSLALHYANVIIVLEKLLKYPHLIGDEARDDLYQMLPTSLRKTLKTNLISYFKDVAIYDRPLAYDWKERIETMLKWLVPLALNMMRWQSEHNFEQQQIITKTNVLLLETLYFADSEKTEAAICEILVGLNYMCRYEKQQNALLDCASSFDFEDCMEWQLQFGGQFRN